MGFLEGLAAARVAIALGLDIVKFVQQAQAENRDLTPEEIAKVRAVSAMFDAEFKKLMAEMGG